MNKRNLFLLAAAFALTFASLACWDTTRPDLVFSPEEMPEAQVGMPYEVVIQVSQNETPVYAFSLSEGALPKGLIFEYIDREDKARIHGVPEEAGTFTFKVAAACLGTNVSGQTGAREYQLVVR